MRLNIPAIRSGLWPRGVCLWVVVLMTVMSSLCAASDRVLIVLSSESTQYKAAADACSNQLAESDTGSKIVDIKHIDGIEIAEYSSCVAIGAKAASVLLNSIDPGMPFYYTLVAQPERIGLTGRELSSGISTDVPVSEQIQLIRMAVPNARAVGLLYDSESPTSMSILNVIHATETDGLQIELVNLVDYKQPIDAIRELYSLNIDVVWTIADPRVYDRSTAKSILIESIKNKIPVFGFSSSLVRAGAAFGVAVNPVRQGERVAELVIRKATGVHLGADPDIILNEIVGDRINHRFSNSLKSKSSTVIQD